MPYRLVGHAEHRIDAILLESAQRWGLPAAARYHLLILATATVVANAPYLPGSREIPRLNGLRIFHLRLARKLVAPGERVATPRHVLVYRVAPDGVVEILSVVHDRMLLSRAARRAVRDAGE